MAMLLCMSQHPQELQLPWDDLDSKERLLPNLELVLENRETQWQTVTRKSKAMAKRHAAVEICTGTAVWYHTGKPSCANPLGTGT